MQYSTVQWFCPSPTASLSDAMRAVITAITRAFLSMVTTNNLLLATAVGREGAVSYKLLFCRRKDLHLLHSVSGHRANSGLLGRIFADLFLTQIGDHLLLVERFGVKRRVQKISNSEFVENFNRLRKELYFIIIIQTRSARIPQNDM